MNARRNATIGAGFLVVLAAGAVIGLVGSGHADEAAPTVETTETTVVRVQTTETLPPVTVPASVPTTEAVVSTEVPVTEATTVEPVTTPEPVAETTTLAAPADEAPSESYSAPLPPAGTMFAPPPSGVAGPPVYSEDDK